MNARAQPETSLDRRRVVAMLLEGRGDLLVVPGLGSATWDCAALGDNPLHFSLWGAMGNASMIGLGLALAQPARRVLVLTGDGDMLMGLGSLATIATQAPANLALVVLDNERHGETGMQPTHTAHRTDLAAAAAACGFAEARQVADEASLRAALPLVHETPGPTFLTVKVEARPLPRALPAPRRRLHQGPLSRRAARNGRRPHLNAGAPMPELRPEQCEFFRENGYLMVENAVDVALLSRLKQEFDAWVEESRAHDAAWGDTVDGRPRFDLEPGHSAETPCLRRVNAPVEVSDAYLAASLESRMVDCVADLIGPDVKLHHTKINSKLPGANTQVKWHQDFSFTPHSNDDVVTALLMVDEVTEENGPLQVLAGSHRGPIHSLWHEGVFTGAVADEVAASALPSAETCIGPAGSVCPDAHAPAARLRRQPLRTAADAPHFGLQRGGRGGALSPTRCRAATKAASFAASAPGASAPSTTSSPLPQLPTGASFFDQQARHRATGEG